MPKLQDFRQVKSISLPSYPDSVIEIYSAILAGDAIKLDIGGQNEVQIGISSLPYFIKSWNFTDGDEKPLPIAMESIGLMQADDLLFLVNEIKNFVNESKKK